MPIVFIHGITVRLDRFDRLLTVVRRGFRESDCDLEISGCYWGDLGRSAGYTGVSIPGLAEGLRAARETRETRDTAILMTLLLEDPLAELTALHDVEQFSLEPLGFRLVPSSVEARNVALNEAFNSVRVQVIAKTAEFGPPNASGSRVEIRQLVHDIFEAAAGADRTLDVSALHEPIFRALTAGICRVMTTAESWPSEFRWNDAAATIDVILNESLGGERRNIIRAASGHALTYALRHGLRRRIMPGLSLFLGDVMAWFRNRDEILGRVAEAVSIAGTSGPLVLVGHSLGGVIAFEYCAQADCDIALLATVGSQVGFFGELGILNHAARLPDGKITVPAQVGTWCNFYDPDDALSFLAAPVLDRVKDIEINTQAPFPIAHSEYWNMRDTYLKLTAAASER